MLGILERKAQKSEDYKLRDVYIGGSNPYVGELNIHSKEFKLRDQYIFIKYCVILNTCEGGC
jgi:hypothetical protein